MNTGKSGGPLDQGSGEGETDEKLFEFFLRQNGRCAGRFGVLTWRRRFDKFVKHSRLLLLSSPALLEERRDFYFTGRAATAP
jgi:hypothetical protein